MDLSSQHSQTPPSAICSWENEGGALTRGRVAVAAVNHLSGRSQTLVATAHFRPLVIARATEYPFRFAYGEKRSDLEGNARALEKVGISTRFSESQTIFNEGDEAKYAYKIVSGAVRLCKHMADGRRQIADFLLPGDFFGFLQFGFYSFTAEAMSDVAMICYTQREVEQISNLTPESRGRLLVLLSQRLVGMQDHLVMLGQQSAKERVACFLLLLADRLCIEADAPLDLPMRRQDIADYLGLTVETVCRVLGGLKRARTIGVPNLHQVILKDISLLRAIAEGDDSLTFGLPLNQEWARPLADQNGDSFVRNRTHLI